MRGGGTPCAATAPLPGSSRCVRRWWYGQALVCAKGVTTNGGDLPCWGGAPKKKALRKQGLFIATPALRCRGSATCGGAGH